MWLAAIVTIASGWQYVASFWSVVRGGRYPDAASGASPGPVMVTGATGVVGAPILRLLVESGRQVGSPRLLRRVGRVR